MLTPDIFTVVAFPCTVRLPLAPPRLASNWAAAVLSDVEKVGALLNSALAPRLSQFGPPQLTPVLSSPGVGLGGGVGTVVSGPESLALAVAGSPVPMDNEYTPGTSCVSEDDVNCI